MKAPIVNLPHAGGGEVDEEVLGWAIPGFQNAHSHAFQLAMAGLTEGLGPRDNFDDFWSWRQKMYHLALNLTPLQMEVIATQLYSHMLTQGYTWVAEFHYLHHDIDGRPYENKAEMGAALLRAAEKTGMGLTLIPIFYNQGGFNKEPLEEQRRFLSRDIDDYLHLHSLASQLCNGPRQRSALGIHSLRSIKPEHILPLIQEAPQDLPWHIHIAEQKKEISDCLEVLGQRPVQWLLDHVSVDERWHLVHATHMTSEEIELLQKRNAHVVICPSTEGNLGDGIFPLQAYWGGGGKWSIGSDSHIQLNPVEELRWLDYIQRMSAHQRNILCRRPGDNSGELLFQEALHSGRAAMGFSRLPSASSDPLVLDESLSTSQRRFQPLQKGDQLDLVVIKPESPLWRGTSSSNWLSTLVYSTSPQDFSGVITGGRWVVKEGRHFLREQSLQDWEKYISALRSE